MTDGSGSAPPVWRCPPAAPLVTDLYEVSMALVYLRQGRTGPATFSLTVRDLPPQRGFLVAAGLADVLDFLERFEIGEDELAAFADALGCPLPDLAPLRGLRFTGDVWAVPEGRVVLAGEPLLEVTAPLPQAQLVETFLLNQVVHQTMLTSKAARCVLAAQGTPVVDFGLRRTHGVEAGMHAARAGAVVGFAGTSNVAAARRYGLAASGTMAHSFIEAFPDEEQAFRTFAHETCGPVTLLVDTYDTGRGVQIAIKVLRELPGHRSGGVRLDSGDLAALAGRARRALDAAALPRARIVVSGGLDEYAIEDLVAAAAPVDVFAVGTRVSTSADAPYLDAAYKLVEYDGRPVMKLSAGKVTAPGAKQVFRSPGLSDELALRAEQRPEGTEPLLQPVLRAGRRLQTPPSAADQAVLAGRRFRSDAAHLPPALRTIRHPGRLLPRPSERLLRLTTELRRTLQAPAGTVLTSGAESGAASRPDA
ncbi:MAG TPA: nicotinate phosphoribosyltransferase [Pseudonocardiaceae bacterium]|nr:nicotinate phosphoribosyltransferase [Pseudonocardiaceae bacterium]